MAKRIVVRLTANFECNLAEIEHFHAEAEAPVAFDALLDDLLTTVIPNLERFPDMGRPFLAIPARSVETTEALDRLRSQMHALTADADTLREYLLRDYLLLYLRLGDRIHLLSIRHHRQLSFDLEGLWIDRH